MSWGSAFYELLLMYFGHILLHQIIHICMNHMAIWFIFYGIFTFAIFHPCLLFLLNLQHFPLIQASWYCQYSDISIPFIRYIQNRCPKLTCIVCGLSSGMNKKCGCFPDIFQWQSFTWMICSYLMHTSVPCCIIWLPDRVIGMPQLELCNAIQDTCHMLPT